MRFAASVTALSLLAACATPAPAGPAAPTTPASTAPASGGSRAAQLLAAAGRANAPTQSDIEHAFGAADITRHDGAGAALTYRLDSCALLLVFTTDTRNAMRLAEAHPSARRTGDAAPTLEQCATEASARRH